MKRVFNIYVIFSLIIILGFSIILIGAYFKIENPWREVINTIGSAILIGGIISALFKLFEEKSFYDEIKRLLRIHDSVDELGLEEIVPEVQSFSYTEIIETSDDLKVIMNDGNRWVGNNAVSLRERFSRKSITEFFFVNPECDFCKVLSCKTREEIDDLKRKINSTVAKIKSLWNESKKIGYVKIFFIEVYPTNSVFISENEIVVTPYQISSGRARIPLYRYKKVARENSIYNFFKNDISHLEKEAECIWDSSKG